MIELVQAINNILMREELVGASQGSLQWYLKNNLNDYKAVLEANSSARDIQNASKAFLHFCTESMDWDNPLYKECCKLAEAGMKLSKNL